MGAADERGGNDRAPHPDRPRTQLEKASSLALARSTSAPRCGALATLGRRTSAVDARGLLATVRLAVLLGLGGCTVGPSYSRPDVTLPEGWRAGGKNNGI